MITLGNTSIRKKLMLVLLLTSSSALFMSAVGFTVSDWFTQQGAMVEKLRAVAGIVASNSVAALTFQDSTSAQNTLSILKEEVSIVSATLFNEQDEMFASFQRDGDMPTISRPQDISGYIDGDLFVVVPVTLEGAQIGSLLVVSDLTLWKKQLQLHIFTVLGVLLLSFAVALIISNRLQRVVSEPILKLAETARRITEVDDYSMRAKKLTEDEIGRLSDDFNDMLDQIQIRDDELQKITEQLEEKVEVRTKELTELAHQLEYQAYHDALTGLANRITFDNHLQQAINQAQRHGGQLAVLFLDLDRFKVVNDTLGHAIGDKLLIQVAENFSNCTRASDTLARLGGDEFAVLLTNIDRANEAEEVAQKLRSAISEPIKIEEYNLHPSTSIGISLFPEDGDSAEIILKNADTAMYRSKDNGRNQITFFSAEMNARSLRRLELDNKLRIAIREQKLEVHYQPRCKADTLEIMGVEALARWNDPEEGPVSPAEFIPLAEEGHDLIGAIDNWVIQTACRDMLGWYQGKEPEINLAVNFSPTEFTRRDPHEIIRKILEQTGFPGSRLELEITESLLGPKNVNISNSFEQICELGVEISIDDFGTAYSSLSRLKQLPLHTLKIDQSFVRDLGKDPDNEIIVRTIINMAHSLNLKVVAEGVETETQYNFVKQHGCDEVQGFLLGRPVPAEEIKKLLASEASGSAICPIRESNLPA